MSDAQNLGLIALLRAGLTGESQVLPTDFDPEPFYGQARRHQIQPICYMGGIHCGLDKGLPVMQTLFRDYCAALHYSERQRIALDELLSAFKQVGVDHMPLKGCGLKDLYPSPEMRTMGDVDILIRTEQYEEKIVPVMERLGFERGVESDHELIWRKDALLVELHKRLIPSYNKDYFAYYGDGWQLATVCDGTRFAMSREDEFVYLFTHFAKHYRDGGIGCRHLADLWLFKRAYAPNEEEVRTKLERLGLLKFYHNIVRVLAVWFELGKGDERTEHITDFVCSSGSWGTHGAHVVAAVVREKQNDETAAQARRKRAIRLLFPSLADMKQKYPVLKRLPILLPGCWVLRGLTAICSGNKVARKGKEYRYATEQRVSEYEQALHYVGLDFNFEE